VDYFNGEMSSKSILYIESKSNEPNNYGSKNDTPIKAIGIFEFDINNLSESEFIGLTFPNNVDNQIQEVIIPYNELKKKLYRNNSYSNNLLVLWLMRAY